MKFRWFFTDDNVGDDWTAWHAETGPCSACCCDGPVDGYHCAPAAYRDEFGVMDYSLHTEANPDALDSWTKMEWKE